MSLKRLDLSEQYVDKQSCMNKQIKTLNILIHFYLDVLFSPNLALGQFNLVLYEEL